MKFVFQGMLGAGHLIASREKAYVYLREEMNSVQPDREEPLTERLSPDRVRLNLRAAKAKGMRADEITELLIDSVKNHPTEFSRQDVYNLCMTLEGYNPHKLKEAAEKLKDETWLPSHSEQYRSAYRPAYRVIYDLQSQ